MIVTTGKIIKVDIGFNRGFECSSEAPGMVLYHDANQGKMIELPGNKEGAKRFCEAYLRTVNEDLGYRKMENE